MHLKMKAEDKQRNSLPFKVRRATENAVVAATLMAGVAT